MTTEELTMLEELLILHYGRSYISNYDVLKDLLEVEFDLEITMEELMSLSKFDFNVDIEDMEITMRNCGINY